MKSIKILIQLQYPFAQISFVTELTTSPSLSKKFKKKFVGF